ncbi:hypothetical protein [Paenibacillus aquistagni]|uniref:hypothetical protein n=1 Tax=Paenibacillus aquistagni TaxID=1852522 RepID=UPI0014828776|nr:hypothetical protein [Paenibacillus aquistagni]
MFLEQCQKVSELSGGLISASLKNSGDIDELQKINTSTIQGSGIQGEKMTAKI